MAKSECGDTLYRAVVIGVSAGGLAALEKILPHLKESFCIPILIVQHISPSAESYLANHFSQRCFMDVKEAEDKEPIRRGSIYFAPPNYHMLVEEDGCIALSVDERVNFSRPSIDVLFESAADHYTNELIGLVLTGANSDGAQGLAQIKARGGKAWVQSPDTADVATMPEAAIAAVDVDAIIPLDEIYRYFNEICEC